ncbi:MAG: elongation factor G [Nitrospirae bacterium]|nr:MAG: elongation factor G [Nitrospirota bacterium]
MKESKPDAIRNVAVLSYGGAGKTTLIEALLCATGTIPQMGSVAAGTAAMDFEPEEHHRKHSLQTSLCQVAWNETALNLLDSPGTPSFQAEARQAAHIANAALWVFNAGVGVKTEMEKVWEYAASRPLPSLLFISALDKDGTSWEKAIEEIEKTLEIKTVPLSIPIGKNAALEGVVDLVSGEAFRYAADGSGKRQKIEIPAVMSGEVEAARKKLMEGAAESDDQLLEKYLGDGTLTAAEILKGLKAGVISRGLFPVLCGSGVKNIGVTELLNAVVSILPSPVESANASPVQATKGDGKEPVVLPVDGAAPFAAYVFKTLIDPFMGRLNYIRVYSGSLAADAGFLNSTRNTKEKGGRLFHGVGKKYTPIEKAVAGDIVAIAKLKDTQTGDTLAGEHAAVHIPKPPLGRPLMSFALEPKSKADVEKVSLGLHKLVEEDPSLEFLRNAETHEMILSAMGQLHVDVAFEKLKRKYGIEVNVHTPKVPYKETIRKTASAQGKYKKQTGGHGQYGDTWLKLEPLKRGGGFEFVNEIVGGAIPRNFIPAVEKGVVEALHDGVLGGFPVVDIRVTLYDGSYHDVDSSEMSFKIAASMGFKKAIEQASPVLLEPIMTVEVGTPDEFMGAVIGDLNSRRGRIQDTIPKAHGTTIKAAVPLAEMLKYAPVLNSLTGGRGTYSMDFSTYEEVPRELVAKVLEEHKTAKTAAVH